jgi:hypothetical protein
MHKLYVKLYMQNYTLNFLERPGWFGLFERFLNKVLLQKPFKQPNVILHI